MCNLRMTYLSAQGTQTSKGWLEVLV
jgi:hypothetical protein